MPSTTLPNTGAIARPGLRLCTALSPSSGLTTRTDSSGGSVSETLIQALC